jgi:hypothetical protein
VFFSADGGKNMCHQCVDFDGRCLVVLLMVICDGVSGLVVAVGGAASVEDR